MDMTWFKNLKTMTKLMLGFGILAVTMAVVGYLGLSGMSSINDNLAILYQRDMMGLAAVKDIDVAVAQIGRHARNIVIFTDRGAMEQDKLKVDSLHRQF